MYSYIKGKLTSKEFDRVVIENGGIGYELLVSGNTSAALNIGAEYTLHSYFQIRQDSVALLGFLSREEKSMFLRLITVSGIGPKNAQAILNEISPYALACAIAKNDALLLSTVKGIGKKTAARIILELKEKIDLAEGEETFDVSSSRTGSTVTDEAAVALQALGFSKNDSQRAVMKARESGIEGIENIIKAALRGIKN